jgi:hypothetical protein
LAADISGESSANSAKCAGRVSSMMRGTPVRQLEASIRKLTMVVLPPLATHDEGVATAEDNRNRRGIPRVRAEEENAGVAEGQRDKWPGRVKSRVRSLLSIWGLTRTDRRAP